MSKYAEVFKGQRPHWGKKDYGMKKSIKSPEETNLNWKHWCELMTSKIHILKYVLYVYVCVCSVMSNSFRPHGLQPARLLCPWNFSRQEYWSRLPFPPPEDLPNPGTERTPSPLAGGFLATSAAWEAHVSYIHAYLHKPAHFLNPAFCKSQTAKTFFSYKNSKVETRADWNFLFRPCLP